MALKETIGQTTKSLKRYLDKEMQHLKWTRYSCLKEIQMTSQSTTIGPQNRQLEKLHEVLEVNGNALKDYLRVLTVESHKKT